MSNEHVTCGCGSKDFQPFFQNQRQNLLRFKCIHCHQAYETDGKHIYLINLLDMWREELGKLKRSERDMENMTRDEQIESVKQLSSLYSEEDHYYLLQDIHEIDPTAYLVKTKIAPKTMELLIAFIQAKADELQHGYSVVKVEMVEVLTKHFEVEASNQYDASWHIIEFYYNWEKWCGKFAAINEIPLFQNEPLVEHLKILSAKAGHAQ